MLQRSSAPARYSGPMICDRLGSLPTPRLLLRPSGRSFWLLPRSSEGKTRRSAKSAERTAIGCVDGDRVEFGRNQTRLAVCLALVAGSFLPSHGPPLAIVFQEVPETLATNETHP